MADQQPNAKSTKRRDEALDLAIHITNEHRLANGLTKKRGRSHWETEPQGAARPRHPLLPHHPGAKIWIKDKRQDVSESILTLVPLAQIDGEVGPADRMQRFYSQRLVYPHVATPLTYLDYIPTDRVGPGRPREDQADHQRFEHIPWQISGDIADITPYPERWGRPVVNGKHEPFCGVGSIGWSYRQKRRFVRKLAMLRILFLFMRSKRLRGGGDRDPQLTGPKEMIRPDDVFAAEINGQTPGAHGPWETVQDMVAGIWRRENNWEHIEELCGQPGRQKDMEKIAGNIDSYTEGMRKADDELDPEMPYVFGHGDLAGAFNIMTKHTNLVGTLDFELGAYVPYSDAINDLSSQYPVSLWEYNVGTVPDHTVRPRLGYSDWDEWTRQANKPFNADPTWTDVRDHMSTHKPKDRKGDLNGETWADYHNQKLGSVGTEVNTRHAVTFDFKDKRRFLSRWGEITWEDFVRGDRFDDHDEHEKMYADKAAAAIPFDHWLFDTSIPVRLDEIQNDDDAKRVVPDTDTDGGQNIGWRYNIAGEWFGPPVMFLVTRFAETYLNDDPLVKWEDPFFHISYTAGWHWLA